MVCVPRRAFFARGLRSGSDLARVYGKSDQIRFPREGFQVDVTINSAAAGQAAEVRKYRILSKGNENTVVQVTEPASERGQIMLMKGRDLWIFMPSISQPVRLALAQRLTAIPTGPRAIELQRHYAPRSAPDTSMRTDSCWNDRRRSRVTYHKVITGAAIQFSPHRAEFYSYPTACQTARY